MNNPMDMFNPYLLDPLENCNLNDINIQNVKDNDNLADINIKDNKGGTEIGSMLLGDYTGMTALPKDPTVTMAYVPFQLNRDTYSEMKALEEGTLFPVLNKPFWGGSRK